MLSHQVAMFSRPIDPSHPHSHVGPISPRVATVTAKKVVGNALRRALQPRGASAAGQPAQAPQLPRLSSGRTLPAAPELRGDWARYLAPPGRNISARSLERVSVGWYYQDAEALLSVWKAARDGEICVCRPAYFQISGHFLTGARLLRAAAAGADPSDPALDLTRLLCEPAEGLLLRLRHRPRHGDQPPGGGAAGGGGGFTEWHVVHLEGRGQPAAAGGGGGGGGGRGGELPGGAHLEGLQDFAARLTGAGAGAGAAANAGMVLQVARQMRVVDLDWYCAQPGRLPALSPLWRTFAQWAASPLPPPPTQPQPAAAAAAAAAVPASCAALEQLRSLDAEAARVLEPALRARSRFLQGPNAPALWRVQVGRLSHLAIAFCPLGASFGDGRPGRPTRVRLLLASRDKARPSGWAVTEMEPWNWFTAVSGEAAAAHHWPRRVEVALLPGQQRLLTDASKVREQNGLLWMRYRAWLEAVHLILSGGQEGGGAAAGAAGRSGAAGRGVRRRLSEDAAEASEASEGPEASDLGGPGGGAGAGPALPRPSSGVDAVEQMRRLDPGAAELVFAELQRWGAQLAGPKAPVLLRLRDAALCAAVAGASAAAGTTAGAAGAGAAKPEPAAASAAGAGGPSVGPSAPVPAAGPGGRVRYAVGFDAHMGLGEEPLLLVVDRAEEHTDAPRQCEVLTPQEWLHRCRQPEPSAAEVAEGAGTAEAAERGAGEASPVDVAAAAASDTAAAATDGPAPAGEAPPAEREEATQATAGTGVTPAAYEATAPTPAAAEAAAGAPEAVPDGMEVDTEPAAVLERKEGAESPKAEAEAAGAAQDVKAEGQMQAAASLKAAPPEPEPAVMPGWRGLLEVAMRPRKRPVADCAADADALEWVVFEGWHSALRPAEPSPPPASASAPSPAPSSAPSPAPAAHTAQAAVAPEDAAAPAAGADGPEPMDVDASGADGAGGDAGAGASRVTPSRWRKRTPQKGAGAEAAQQPGDGAALEDEPEDAEQARFRERQQALRLQLERLASAARAEREGSGPRMAAAAASGPDPGSHPLQQWASGPVPMDTDGGDWLGFPPLGGGRGPHPGHGPVRGVAAEGWLVGGDRAAVAAPSAEAAPAVPPGVAVGPPLLLAPAAPGEPPALTQLRQLDPEAGELTARALRRRHVELEGPNAPTVWCCGTLVRYGLAICPVGATYTDVLPNRLGGTPVRILYVPPPPGEGSEEEDDAGGAGAGVNDDESSSSDGEDGGEGGGAGGEGGRGRKGRRCVELLPRAWFHEAAGRAARSYRWQLRAEVALLPGEVHPREDQVQEFEGLLWVYYQHWRGCNLPAGGTAGSIREAGEDSSDRPVAPHLAAGFRGGISTVSPHAASGGQLVPASRAEAPDALSQLRCLDPTAAELVAELLSYCERPATGINAPRLWCFRLPDRVCYGLAICPRGSAFNRSRHKGTPVRIVFASAHDGTADGGGAAAASDTDSGIGSGSDDDDFRGALAAARANSARVRPEPGGAGGDEGAAAAAPDGALRSDLAKPGVWFKRASGRAVPASQATKWQSKVEVALLPWEGEGGGGEAPVKFTTVDGLRWVRYNEWRASLPVSRRGRARKNAGEGRDEPEGGERPQLSGAGQGAGHGQGERGREPSIQASAQAQASTAGNHRNTPTTTPTGPQLPAAAAAVAAAVPAAASSRAPAPAAGLPNAAGLPWAPPAMAGPPSVQAHAAAILVAVARAAATEVAARAQAPGAAAATASTSSAPAAAAPPPIPAPGSVPLPPLPAAGAAPAAAAPGAAAAGPAPGLASAPPPAAAGGLPGPEQPAGGPRAPAARAAPATGRPSLATAAGSAAASVEADLDWTPPRAVDLLRLVDPEAAAHVEAALPHRTSHTSGPDAPASQMLWRARVTGEADLPAGVEPVTIHYGVAFCPEATTYRDVLPNRLGSTPVRVLFLKSPGMKASAEAADAQGEVKQEAGEEGFATREVGRPAGAEPLAPGGAAGEPSRAAGGGRSGSAGSGTAGGASGGGGGARELMDAAPRNWYDVVSGESGKNQRWQHRVDVAIPKRGAQVTVRSDRPQAAALHGVDWVRYPEWRNRIESGSSGTKAIDAAATHDASLSTPATTKPMRRSSGPKTSGAAAAAAAAAAASGSVSGPGAASGSGAATTAPTSSAAAAAAAGGGSGRKRPPPPALDPASVLGSLPPGIATLLLDAAREPLKEVDSKRAASIAARGDGTATVLLRARCSRTSDQYRYGVAACPSGARHGDGGPGRETGVRVLFVPPDSFDAVREDAEAAPASDAAAVAALQGRMEVLTPTLFLQRCSGGAHGTYPWRSWVQVLALEETEEAKPKLELTWLSYGEWSSRFKSTSPKS
ncbi:hypothetical protein GPECTOR_63g20 [Gonium pectorale]|uniref:Uncharacterized protein n=1 Tax=Gonium pectorale TaxID=33097 RepID=A0A150G4A0_GONPE|nr:hypothetical protein GPECTOR_63g20 [Gonium pectorale]|eukprot:KXZ44692.1 hypothetical protein GPECTOR_63g20 [Gonium pectorale]